MCSVARAVVCVVVWKGTRWDYTGSRIGRDQRAQARTVPRNLSLRKLGQHALDSDEQ